MSGNLASRLRQLRERDYPVPTVHGPAGALQAVAVAEALGREPVIGIARAADDYPAGSIEVMLAGDTQPLPAFGDLEPAEQARLIDKLEEWAGRVIDGHGQDLCRAEPTMPKVERDSEVASLGPVLGRAVEILGAALAERRRDQLRLRLQRFRRLLQDGPGDARAELRDRAKRLMAAGVERLEAVDRLRGEDPALALAYVMQTQRTLDQERAVWERAEHQRLQRRSGDRCGEWGQAWLREVEDLAEDLVAVRAVLIGRPAKSADDACDPGNRQEDEQFREIASRLNSIDIDALQYLAKQTEPRIQDEIGVAVNRGRSAVSPRLIKLEKAGLIEPPPGRAKGRLITRRGRQFLAWRNRRKNGAAPAQR